MKSELIDDDLDQGELEIDADLRTIYLSGPLHSKLVWRFLTYWSKFESICKSAGNRQTMTVVVYSDGGDSLAGLALYDKIRSSGIPTRTIAIGEVASAAIIVFLAGQKRLIHENTFIWFHQTQLMVTENDDRNDIERELGESGTIDRHYQKIILANSKLTRRQIIKMEREKYLMSAEEAVKYGLAHGIIKNN